MKINLKPIGDQVVVIVGASSGIGRLAALQFAKRGAKIAVSARSETGLKSLVEEIEAKGGEAFYVVADVSDFEQVKSIADLTIKKFGRFDTWIHTAAAFVFGTVELTEPAEYKRAIEVNLLGQIYGAKSALPFLKENGGALIHVNSAEAWRTAPYQSAYGASKHGIHGFLQVLRVEIEHEKLPISLTEILPGAINTPIYDKARNKMPFKLRAVPPVYHPRVVTDAILFAAENPAPELIAGSGGLGVILAERFSPRLADFLSEKIGFLAQTTDQNNGDKNGGNLFEPVSGFDKVEGSFSDEQLEGDPYTWLKTNPKVKNALLAAGGLLGGFLAWRAVKGKK